MAPTWLIILASLALVLTIAGGWYFYRRCPRCRRLTLVNHGFIGPAPGPQDETRQVLMRCRKCSFEKTYPVSHSSSSGGDGGGGGDGGD